MVKTFESFSELADAMCAGEGILHLFCCAQNQGVTSPCQAWQDGVQGFARWLDALGITVSISDNRRDFYDPPRPGEPSPEPQSANAVKPQATDERSEEHQQQEQGE